MCVCFHQQCPLDYVQNVFSIECVPYRMCSLLNVSPTECVLY